MRYERPAAAAVLCLALGCDVESARPEPATEIVCAATAGGDGAPHGTVLVIAGAIEGEVERAVVAEPGAGGVAGSSELGPAASDGRSAVAEPGLEVSSNAGMFDRSPTSRGCTCPAHACASPRATARAPSKTSAARSRSPTTTQSSPKRPRCSPRYREIGDRRLQRWCATADGSAGARSCETR